MKNKTTVPIAKVECIDEDLLAIEVLHHIDTMYPAMWSAVAKSARQSIRNVIRNQVSRQRAILNRGRQ